MVAEKEEPINLKGHWDSCIVRRVGIVDRSIVRPVLDALDSLATSRHEIDAYYRIVDRFCALWIGRSRAEMGLEADETTYLAHELLREYLRVEGGDRRVALWLLTINRCCQNAAADLSRVREEFAATVREADLDFDHTLLAPILEKVRLFEERHANAADQGLGAQDILGNYYQWIGIYCTYVYPRLVRDARASDRSMVSTLAFLISEFISLKENVSRVAALLLAIKEACATSTLGDGLAGGGPAGIVDSSLKPGTEAEYVQEILRRLGPRPAGPSGAAHPAGRAEEMRPAAPDAAGEPAAATGEPRRAAARQILAAAAELARAAPSEVRAAAARVEVWARQEARRAGPLLGGAARELLDRETARSRETALRMAESLRVGSEKVLDSLVRRLEAATGTARDLLARLLVLAFLESLTTAAGNPAAGDTPGGTPELSLGDGASAASAETPAGRGLMAAMRAARRPGLR
jgi:hypothetical protein